VRDNAYRGSAALTSHMQSFTRPSERGNFPRMTHDPELAEIVALPPEKRLVLVEQTWDLLAARPEAVPIPQWQSELVSARLEADDLDDSPGQDWSELRRRLLDGK
jgi:putative addiction module component (TIGR02574 family)